MAVRSSEPSSGRVIVATRALFAVIAIGAMVFGYFGLRTYIVTHPDHYGPASVTNLLYYDISLFLLQASPAAGGDTLPWQLEVARFAAASFVAYTVTELLVGLSANRVRRTRLRRASGHAVVCGDTRAARFLAAELRQRGTRVVVIDDQAERDSEPWFVAGDPSNPRVLLEAGVQRAAVMYACFEESQRNAEIVSVAENIRAGRARPRRIYAMVTDPELCVMMKARRWSSADADGAPLLHVDFFNPDELAAQASVRADRLMLDGPEISVGADADADGEEGAVPEFAIVGSGAFGRAVLVELAREWLPHVASTSPSAAGVTGVAGVPMQITLVADDAAEAVAQVRQRFPFVDDACVLHAYRGTLPQMLEERQRFSEAPLRRLYLCQEVESDALKAALTAVAYLRSSVEAVVVRLDRLSGIAQAFERNLTGRALLDAFGGRLRVVDVIHKGCDPANIGDDLVETLARASHNRYVAQRLADGAVRGGSVAMRAWEELPEDRRTANREQAMDIGRKLARIGCLLAPRSEATQDFGFHSGEVELLAELEHVRWVAERRRSGWAHGDTRDETARKHPDLVPWSELSNGSRDKDRQAVEAIPGLLADVGLGIIRLRPYPLAAAESADTGGGPGATVNGMNGMTEATSAGTPSAR